MGAAVVEEVVRVSRLTPYIELIEAFLAHRLTADEFSARYYERMRDETAELPREDYVVLQQLWEDAEGYEPDPEVRAELPFGIDAAELEQRAAMALAKLRRLDTGS